MLVIADDNVTRFQFLYEIRVSSVFDHIDSITDKAHDQSPKTLSFDTIIPQFFCEEKDLSHFFWLSFHIRQKTPVIVFESFYHKSARII